MVPHCNASEVAQRVGTLEGRKGGGAFCDAHFCFGNGFS